jgi:putative ABC transport system permease protein
MNTVLLAAKLARREMRGGLAGFRIFFLCLALGVAAIAGVESLASAFLTGIGEQSRTLLGGDVQVSLTQRAASAAEYTFMTRYGHVSESATLRAMAYAVKNNALAERNLIELKAVDDKWPLFGAAELSPAQPITRVLACTDMCGAVAEQTLLDRLHVQPGATLRIGSANFRLSARIVSEPDRVSGGFDLGPHILISTEGLKRTGLVTVGSIINYQYRVAFNQPTSSEAFEAAANDAFPDGRWRVRDRSDAAPGVRRFVEQVTMFLTLIGLTALAVGGIGAGQSVSAFLDRKRAEIAALKALGADGTLIFFTFFLQVMTIALAGIIVGLSVGASLPFVVEAVYGSDIPAPAHFGVYPLALLLAAAFGILSAVAFALPPLARSREIMPASLFRDIVAPSDKRGALPYLLAAAAAGAALIALALAIAPRPTFAAQFLFGSVASLVLLRLLAGLLKFGLKKLPRAKNPVMRLAIANLIRPGSATTDVITALGLGLTLLATVSLLDATIAAQVAERLPGKAPSFYFVDIQKSDVAAFDRTVESFKTISDYRRTPQIRGRIVAVKGVPSEQVRIQSGSRWALNGDRGITYSTTPPKGSVITDGKWWPADYSGPTLISFDKNLAEGMGVKVGDKLTVNVLGRDIEGTIANLRDVDFTTGQQNFVLVMSPGVVDQAPHTFLATVIVSNAEEPAMYRAVTDRFPNISTVRVKDAIAQVDAILNQLGDGVRAASLLTIFAGLLVLAGAIAAGSRARLYDSTILKVLGATRARIAAVYALEYGLLGVLTGIVAFGLGAVASSFIAENMLQINFVFDVKAAFLTIFGGGVATLAFGLAGAITALAAKPTRQLRAP